jgi:CDP-glycerol glycerophosphotransferase (TagB/SpsB family)
MIMNLFITLEVKMRYILDLIAENINANQLQNAYDLIIENEDLLIGNAEYWNLRGILCLKVEEYTAAISCLSKAIELDELNGDIYYNYAYAFERIGNQSDAALYYGKAYRYMKDENIKAELSRFYTNDDALGNIFTTAANGMKKNFIILSSNVWRDSYQRTHHIARSLAKFGHDVHYIEKPLSTVVNNRNITNSDLLQLSLDRRRTVEGVNIYSTLEVLNQRGQFVANNYLEMVQFILDSFFSKSEEVVIITYLPKHINIIESLKGDFYHIYECVDDHSDLEYAFWGNKNDALLEQKLMDKADAITTTATSLFLQRVAIEKRDNTYLSKNAVNELDFLLETTEVPEDLVNIPEPRVVFAGHVYKRFDEELFYEVVESNPDKSFVVIGSVQEDMLTRKYKNLYLLGEKKHYELKNYLHNMQIGIVPYIYNSDMDIACDSIKQYEYLACNLPVITTFMPESSLEKIYALLANTKEDFNKAIERCLSLKLDQEELSRFLVKNSWNNRAALLCNIADGKIGASERKQQIEKIGIELQALIETYHHPIFDSVYAIYLNIFDNCLFEKNMKKIYESVESDREKYIEKQYITSLIINNNIEKLVEVVVASSFIRKEIREEIEYRNIRSDHECILALANYCINNIKDYLVFVDRLEDQNTKTIYLSYINYKIQERIDESELNKYKGPSSPLYLYLRNNVKNEMIYIANLFNKEIDQDFLDALKKNHINYTGFCLFDTLTETKVPAISVKQLAEMQRNNNKTRIIVNYDATYVTQVRALAEQGISECEVAYFSNTGLELTHINSELMKKVKEREYLRTIVFNKFNAADSNVGALLKYMPEEYKDKYKVHVIHGMDVYTPENIVKVPLISSITVSGFATFLYLPKFTFNIEIGHAGIILKACGLMDKKDKNSGGNPEIFKKADIVCVASHMQKVVFSSFYAIPEDKYRITGLARNDMLMRANGKENLEKLLNRDISNKKIIFNMPTFHVFDRKNRIEGNAELNDSFKIFNFDYKRFDTLLEENNMLCISKVHHGEENSVSKKSKNRKYNNLYFIDNNILDSFGFDLYEILNAADVLITDYSTIYNDFLFMNKPTVFVNTDIEEYRLERGLALEPYDFWTAGPKVQTQDQLEQELIKSCFDDGYYKSDRERLAPVFFEKRDAKSVQNTWEIIDKSMTEIRLKDVY